MTRSPRAILFDLDGTLLDCHATHFEVFQTTFRTIGIELSTSLYRRLYSPNWYQSYAALGLPPQIWKRIDRLWLGEMRQRVVLSFPGVEPLLARLADRFCLGLVTAGTGSRVRRDLERNRIDSYFDVVVTGDDVTRPKPHPQGLELALERLQVGRDDALYVGDSEVDFEMADRLGVDFVAVASPVSKFRTFERPQTLDNVTDLGSVLDGQAAKVTERPSSRRRD